MESEYHKTFLISEEKEIIEFFREHGYVAIREILTTEECEKTLGEMNE